MNRTRDIQALWRYMRLLQIVSIGMMCFGGLAIALFLNPTFLGGTLKNTDSMWLWVGMGFIVAGMTCIVLSASHYRRLLWILHHVTPKTMQLLIRVERDSEGTNYVAILDHEWEVRVYSPSWKVGHLKKSSIAAQVYFDPKSHRPVVMETQEGILWGMAIGSAYHIQP